MSAASDFSYDSSSFVSTLLYSFEEEIRGVCDMNAEHETAARAKRANCRTNMRIELFAADDCGNITAAVVPALVPRGVTMTCVVKIFLDERQTV